MCLSAGYGHTCAVLKTGGLHCWGHNDYGQLGDGTTTDTSTPPTQDLLSDAVAVSAGRSNTCVLRETGTIRCFGDGYLEGDCCRDNPSVALEICQ